MTIGEAFQLALAALFLVSAAESFRARPWWPHSPARSVAQGPARGTSPRERRWIHAGLGLAFVGNVLGVVPREGGTVDPLAWGMVALGAVAVIVGLVRGPARADLAYFERLHGDRPATEPEDG